MADTVDLPSEFQAELMQIRLPLFAARCPRRPFVVALEGPNGAGKTTLAGSLSGRLHVPICLGTDFAWFSEPFKTRMIRDAEWYASAMFFLSGCFEQMRMLRALSERRVVMDRSLWSTLAVHAATDARRLAALVAMLKPIADVVEVPDLTIVLEASFAACQARISAKTGNARALDELTAEPGFHERERDFYRWLGNKHAGFAFIDVTTAQPAQVVDRAVALVLERLGTC